MSEQVDHRELTEKLDAVVNGEQRSQSAELEAAIDRVAEMGFSREAARQALERNDLDVDGAIASILNGGEYDHLEASSPALFKDYNTQEEGNSVQVNGLVPATKEFYDDTLWSMVPMGSPGITEGDGVEDRKRLLASARDANLPPILLGERDSVLPMVLFIIHEIPLARKLFLRAVSEPDSQFDNTWLEEAENEVKISPEYQAFLESQRAMGFLDGLSKRAAVDVTRLEQLSQSSLKGLVEAVNKLWAAEDRKAFISEGYNASEEESVTFIDLLCDVTPSLKESIYTVVDSMIWVPGSEVYITHTADILSLTMKRDDGASGAGLQLPLIWYPDRYTQENSHHFKRANELKTKLQARIRELSNMRFRHSIFQGKKVSEILSTTTDYFEKQHLAIAADITLISAKFHEHIAVIEQEISEIQGQLSKIGLLLTDDGAIFTELFPDAPVPTLRPYHLVGVVISPTELCFKKRVTGDLGDEKPTTDEEWFHLSVQGNTTVNAVSADDVLMMAEKGSSVFQGVPVVALYANDYALNSDEHKEDVSEDVRKAIRLTDRAVLQSTIS